MITSGSNRLYLSLCLSASFYLSASVSSLTPLSLPLPLPLPLSLPLPLPLPPICHSTYNGIHSHVFPHIPAFTHMLWSPHYSTSQTALTPTLTPIIDHNWPSTQHLSRLELHLMRLSILATEISQCNYMFAG